MRWHTVAEDISPAETDETAPETIVALCRSGLVPAGGQQPLSRQALAACTGQSPAGLAQELRAEPHALRLRIRAVLHERSEDTDAVLVVDQFEELFTLCDNESERAAFIAALVEASSAPDTRARIVIGVRLDFYPQLTAYPELVPLLQDGQLLVGPMTTEELRPGSVPRLRAALPGLGPVFSRHPLPAHLHDDPLTTLRGAFRQGGHIMRIGVLVVAIAALAIAGCSPDDSSSGTTSSTTTAAPTTTPPVDMHGTITAKSRLGDVRTLNPCSLVDLSTLPADLSAVPASPQDQNPSLDACNYMIVAGRKGALLVVGRLTSTLPNTITGPAEPLDRGLALHGGTLVDNDCKAAVELGDGTYLISEADLNLGTVAHPGTGLEPPCQAAHDGAADIANVLLSNVPMRHRGTPVNSLTGLNPCDLLAGRQVDGLALEARADEPAGECIWPGGYARQPILRLQFTTVIPPSGPQVIIGGRATFRFGQDSKPVTLHVPADGNESICQAETVEGPGTGNLVEIAEVTVTDQPGQQDHACLLATDLAKLAWSKLPPAAT